MDQMWKQGNKEASVPASASPSHERLRLRAAPSSKADLWRNHVIAGGLVLSLPLPTTPLHLPPAAATWSGAPLWLF